MTASDPWRGYPLEGRISRANKIYAHHLASSPSAWFERLPILTLALAGFCIASYLAAYQLGIVPSVWEPFFGTGARRVLHSFLSKLLPLPDAVLGAIGYLVEFIAGLIGGQNRWRDWPWLVLIYGAIVAALGVTALALTAIQLFFLHAFCTLCLTSAAISLVIAWLACREVLAAFHKMRTS